MTTKKLMRYVCGALYKAKFNPFPQVSLLPSQMKPQTLANLFFALSAATIGVFAVEPCDEPDGIARLPLSRVPAEGATWVVGTKENITWFGCSSLPAGTARITLGPGSYDDNVLVPDFDFFTHPDFAEVTVPDVPDGEYFIAIWGDSENANFNARFSVVHSS
ncbi:hypothetical protein D9758_007124 [Tetrapyrgos nigripes]|uniref:Uncharacterized protein n=1 Tax=Tetrapyrgos nigripes TaxID=182062 RepID=A0A8H5LMV5_9AGAR|nr:hypothetical protein D9758_007124 [Tetrapyrgos nigripes]